MQFVMLVLPYFWPFSLNKGSLRFGGMSKRTNMTKTIFELALASF